jgi:acyl-CoA synthetase (AMP-forming)/AMP-acid ligase II
MSVLPRATLPPAADAIRALIERRAASQAAVLVEGSTGRELSWAAVAARHAGWDASAAAVGTRRVRGRPAGGGRRPASDRTARVGLLIADPLEMAAAFVSALATGVTVAPLDPRGATPDLVRRVGTLGLAAVVGGGDDLDRHGAALQAAGVDLWAAGPAGPAFVARGHGDARTGGGGGAAVVMCSSGTTGAPKLIPLGADTVLHTAHAVVSHHRLDPSDRGYSPLPLSHINGLVVGVAAAFVGGHSLIVDRRFSASSFWDIVHRRRATWCNLVPAMISILATIPPPDPAQTARVSFARSASAPLPLATMERFEAATGVQIVETYGMTEAGSQVASNPRPPERRRPGSVGVAVGVEIRVTDGLGRPVPDGQVGGIEIRGDHVASEYWAPPGESPEVRPALGIDGWLATGDLGRIDADGWIYLTGRDDDVINRGGEKLYPREVEEVLFADPGVAAAAVVGRPHPIVGEEPVAYVVAAPGVDGETLLPALIERCRTELSGFRRPVEIVLVGSLPCGPNGKIRRADLRAAAGPAERSEVLRLLVTPPLSHRSRKDNPCSPRRSTSRPAPPSPGAPVSRW